MITKLANLMRLIVVSSVFTGIWLILTEANLQSAVLGVFFVAASIGAWHYLGGIKSPNRQQISVFKLPYFIMYFVGQSFLGGLETARIAFKRKLSLTTEFIDYEFHTLSSGTAVSFFVNAVSLIPGSLVAIRAENHIVVHVLEKNEKTLKGLSECETQVCKLFDIRIKSDVF